MCYLVPVDCKKSIEVDLTWFNKIISLSKFDLFYEFNF